MDREALFNSCIKPAADSPARLRASDLNRVFEAAADRLIGTDHSIAAFGIWLKEQDLMPRTRQRLERDYAD